MRGAGQNLVTLDPAEAMRAAQIGAGRVLRHRREGDEHLYGEKRDAYRDWGRDIEAVGAEMAFAKWLGVYYHPTTKPDDGTDVAGVQVRSTPASGGHLLLHKKDTGPCVLLVGQIPEFTVAGWVDADEAKTESRWRDTNGRPCYWVEQPQLLGLGALREWAIHRLAA